MRRAERLFRIVDEMRARGVSRARDLAEHFEVGIATIYRDIAHLRASGLPIDGEAGVGYLLRPGFDWPSVTFTHDQLDALAIGLAFVESAGDPELSTAAREARAKIQANLPEPEQRKLADAPYFSLQGRNRPAQEAALLREAIRARRAVLLRYRDAEGRRSERRLRPLAVWSSTDGWMVSGWCELRCGFRTFRFDRIEAITLTDERFEDDETTGLRAFLRSERCEG